MGNIYESLIKQIKEAEDDAIKARQKDRFDSDAVKMAYAKGYGAGSESRVMMGESRLSETEKEGKGERA